MRRFLPLALLSVAACEYDYYTRPDYTIWEIPQDATMLPLPKTSLVTGGPFDFSGVKGAQLTRRADGVVQARVWAQEVYYIGNDFGGASPVFVDIFLCYDYTDAEQTLTGYSPMKGGEGDLSRCPPENGTDFSTDNDATVTPFLPAFVDGAQASGFNGTFTHVTMPTMNGDPVFFGSTTFDRPLVDDYSDYALAKDSFKPRMVMRGVLHDGKPTQMALDFTPDAVDMVGSLITAVGEHGKDYFWPARDEAIYRIDPDSIPLRLQYLGQGVFNLKNEPNVAAAKGHTIGVVVAGDQWTAIFATVGKDLNLSMRTKKIASSEFKAIRPFKPTIVSTPTARSMRVCFNEQLDVSTLTPAAFTFDPPLQVTTVAPSTSQLCAWVGTEERPYHAVRVTVRGLKSVFGNSLPDRGVQFGVTGDRAHVIDLMTDTFRNDTLDGTRRVVEIEAIAPTSSGGAVAVNTEIGKRQMSRVGKDFSFMLPFEQLPSGPLSTKQDPRGQGLWVLSRPDAGVVHLSRFDDLPAESVDVNPNTLTMLPLGDGTVVLSDGQGAVQRVSGGIVSAVPPGLAGKTIFGYVNGSPDLLTSLPADNARVMVERREPTDGGVVGLWGPVIYNPRQMLDSYICATFLYKALPDGGVSEILETGTAYHIDCDDMVRAPDGTLYVTAVGSTPERLFMVDPVGAHQVDWHVSRSATGRVVRPRFTPDGVFFWVSPGGGSNAGPNDYYFATSAQWAGITDGGLP